MALQDILKKILDEAEKKAKEIQSQTVEACKKLDAEFEELSKIDATESDKRLKSAIETADKKMSVVIRRESSQRILAAKQELIRKSLEKFVDSLENADDKLYGEILQKLFADFSWKSGQIFAPKNRVEITKKFAPAGCEIVGSDEIHGGFHAKSDSAEVDRTFKNLIFSEFRDEIAAHFAEQLKFL